uniref:Glyco_hydro_4C domain-containing protein n=1 Tax=Caenorhabditis tropicalis TaxID=1561998 RepID=A0A1I7UMZ8_9PELO
MFKNISAVREIVTYGEEQVLRSIETYNLQEGNVGLSVAVAQQIPGMVLHKTETISDWTVDRLRVPQERYAGLDSAVLQLLDNRRPAPNPHINKKRKAR